MIAALLFSTGSAQADSNKPEVRLFTHHAPSHLPDGAIIGHGKVAYSGAHSGFQVWLEGATQDGAPGHYLIAGTNHRGHALRVRIEGDGWVRNVLDGNGLTIFTRDERVHFNLVSDGEQDVPSDEYQIRASGVLLLSPS